MCKVAGFLSRDICCGLGYAALFGLGEASIPCSGSYLRPVALLIAYTLRLPSRLPLEDTKFHLFINDSGNLQAITMELTRSMQLFLGYEVDGYIGYKWYDNKR